MNPRQHDRPQGPAAGIGAASGYSMANAALPRADRASSLTPAVTSRTRVGGREWLALPEFGIACIRARLDSRSDESRLGASSIVLREGETGFLAWFLIHPVEGDERTVVVAAAPLAEGSESAAEPLIRTRITLGDETWPIELRLVPHPRWRRCLHLGGPALDHRFAVDPEASFLAGPPRPG